jgi:hypothetical protein
MGVEDKHAKQYWKSRQAEWIQKKSLVCLACFMRGVGRMNQMMVYRARKDHLSRDKGLFSPLRLFVNQMTHDHYGFAMVSVARKGARRYK